MTALSPWQRACYLTSLGLGSPVSGTGEGTPPCAVDPPAVRCVAVGVWNTVPVDQVRNDRLVSADHHPHEL